MIKEIKLILMIIILANSMASAQVNINREVAINITTSIVSNSPVELTTLSNMIIQGNYGKEKEVYISPVTNTNAGLMRAKGIPNSEARMTYIIHEELGQENKIGTGQKKGEGIISVAYELSGYPERVQRSSTLISTGETVLKFGNDGYYYIWVGGHINLANAIPGKYTGQFTVEIIYL